MNANRTGPFLLLLTLTSGAVSATPSLGEASGFNVFALGNLTQLGGDSEGPVAIGGSASLASLAVNARNVDAPYGLVVGGSLQATDGTLNGNLAYGRAAELSSFTVSGKASQSSPIDFISARIDLEARSAYWASSLSSAWLGKVTYFDWGGVTLAGTDRTLNVFNVDGSRVRSTLHISAPEGSTVLVNVSGKSNSWSGFKMQTSGVDKTHLLFNFFESTSVAISSLSFQGTLFAPKADLTLESGNIEGNTVANNVTATWWSGEFHNQPFTGTIPFESLESGGAPTPEPATLLVIGAGLIAIAAAVKTKKAVQP
ncbi:MAG: choice-of-anchor A family protein [Bryobacteraceae bacterium]|nr:choice-of-anchor A family protein [Bryobacteraceae bacterium]